MMYACGFAVLWNYAVRRKGKLAVVRCGQGDGSFL